MEAGLWSLAGLAVALLTFARREGIELPETLRRLEDQYAPPDG